MFRRLFTFENLTILFGAVAAAVIVWQRTGGDL